MNKTILYSNFLLLQVFFFLFLSYNYIFVSYRVDTFIIVLIVLLVTILNVYIFIELVRLIAKQREAEIAKLRLEEADKLITSLRSKHHDFINHLQVIMGLTQLKKYDDIIAYGKELSQDLVQIEKLVSLKRPEVAALISSKVAGISYMQTSLDITTTLEGLHVPPDKLVSMLGNLIDNAIYETSFRPDKWLNIGLHEDPDWFIFEITNPGVIPEEIEHRIFEAGFTTKGEKGSGMGLYIVKNLVADYKGVLSLNTLKAGEITFVIKLPKAV